MEQEDITNKIIAIGLNSINKYTVESEKELLNIFAKQSFSVIFPVWKYLNQDVKFSIFTENIENFESFMISQMKDATKASQ